MDSNANDITVQHMAEDDSGPSPRMVTHMQNFLRMGIYELTGVTLIQYMNMNVYQMNTLLDGIAEHNDYVATILKNNDPVRR